MDAKLAKLTKQLKETNLVQSRASKAKTLNAKQGRDPQKSQPGAGRFFLVHDVLVFLLQIQTANFLLSLLGSMFNPGFLGPFSKHPSWASQAIQARPAKHKHREPFMRLLKKRDAGEKRKKETRGEANRAPRSEGRPLWQTVSLFLSPRKTLSRAVLAMRMRPLDLAQDMRNWHGKVTQRHLPWRPQSNALKVLICRAASVFQLG